MPAVDDKDWTDVVQETTLAMPIGLEQSNLPRIVVSSARLLVTVSADGRPALPGAPRLVLFGAARALIPANSARVKIRALSIFMFFTSNVGRSPGYKKTLTT